MRERDLWMVPSRSLALCLSLYTFLLQIRCFDNVMPSSRLQHCLLPLLQMTGNNSTRKRISLPDEVVQGCLSFRQTWGFNQVSEMHAVSLSFSALLCSPPSFLPHFSGGFFPWGSWHNCQQLLALPTFTFNLEESRSLLLRNLRKKTKPPEPISYVCATLSICTKEPCSLLSPCFGLYYPLHQKCSSYKYPSPTVATFSMMPFMGTPAICFFFL